MVAVVVVVVKIIALVLLVVVVLLLVVVVVVGVERLAPKKSICLYESRQIKIKRENS